MTKVSKCPECGKDVPEKVPAFWPFCSERCKMLDLGKWMREDYRIPVVDPSSEEDDLSDFPPPESSDDD